jgi:hypothetical protein
MVKKSEIVGANDAFTLDHNEYSKVSRMAQLREIKLIASTYLVRPEAFAVDQDIENMRNSFTGKCSDFLFDEADGLVWGRFQWIAEIKSRRKSCLKLTCEYLVLYSEVFECDAQHVETYFRKVGRFATYPYFRATFSHSVGETGIFLPPLPTLAERVD